MVTQNQNKYSKTGHNKQNSYLKQFKKKKEDIKTKKGRKEQN